MIMDNLTEFCDAVSLAGATGTQNQGDIVNTLAAGITNQLLVTLDPGTGQGDEVFLVITVESATAGNGVGIIAAAPGTISFRLVSDATSTISTTTATVHYTSRAFVTDVAGSEALKEGSIAVVTKLPADQTYEQFLGVQTIVATANPTAGKINAFLTTDARKWKSYADAIN